MREFITLLIFITLIGLIIGATSVFDSFTHENLEQVNFEPLLNESDKSLLEMEKSTFIGIFRGVITNHINYEHFSKLRIDELKNTISILFLILAANLIALIVWLVNLLKSKKTI